MPYARPPADVSETVPVSSKRLPSAPIVSIGTPPDAPADEEAPRSSKKPSSRPPPLPDVAPAPDLTKPAEGDPRAPKPTAQETSVPKRTDTPAREGRPSAPPPIAKKAHAARWIALALGAGVASVWLSAQHAGESASERARGAIDKQLDIALARAKGCERGAPSAQELTVTFTPDGKVSAAELAGEAFADFETVRECILGQVRELSVPPFEGPEIRVQRKIGQ